MDGNKDNELGIRSKIHVFIVLWHSVHNFIPDGKTDH
jgi:hypothetical protein